jgi:hypothetical protein
MATDFVDCCGEHTVRFARTDPCLICILRADNKRLRGALREYVSNCGCAAGCRRCEGAEIMLSYEDTVAVPSHHIRCCIKTCDGECFERFKDY